MDGTATGTRTRHENIGAVTESVFEPVAARAQGHWRQLVGLALACLCAAVAVGVLLARHEPRPAAEARPTGPVLLSEVQLQQFAAAAGQPVYWAGPRRGYVYEVTRTRSGRVFVRYLPQGFVAGDARASFLTVATYPTAHAYENLRRAAKALDARASEVADDGIALTSTRAPASAYLAYPRADYQVEVYDPAAGHASKLLLNGAIVRVG